MEWGGSPGPWLQRCCLGGARDSTFPPISQVVTEPLAGPLEDQGSPSHFLRHAAPGTGAQAGRPPSSKQVLQKAGHSTGPRGRSARRPCGGRGCGWRLEKQPPCTASKPQLNNHPQALGKMCIGTESGVMVRNFG